MCLFSDLFHGFVVCSCWFFLVVRVPLYCCLRWPLTVASVFGRYFWESLTIKPGHDVNASFLMAFIKAFLVGLKHVAW